MKYYGSRESDMWFFPTGGPYDESIIEWWGEPWTSEYPDDPIGLFTMIYNPVERFIWTWLEMFRDGSSRGINRPSKLVEYVIKHGRSWDDRLRGQMHWVNMIPDRDDCVLDIHVADLTMFENGIPDKRPPRDVKLVRQLIHALPLKHHAAIQYIYAADMAVWNTVNDEVFLNFGGFPAGVEYRGDGGVSLFGEELSLE